MNTNIFVFTNIVNTLFYDAPKTRGQVFGTGSKEFVRSVVIANRLGLVQLVPFVADLFSFIPLPIL